LLALLTSPVGMGPANRPYRSAGRVPAQIRFIVFESVVPALHVLEISGRSIGLSPVFAGRGFDHPRVDPLCLSTMHKPGGTPTVSLLVRTPRQGSWIAGSIPARSII